jgi:PQQ-dependent catabolism-associated CXXCW motif protein
MRARIGTAAKAAIAAAIAVAAALLPAVGGVGWAADAPEPPGLWTGAMYGQTPRTLGGAAVVDLAALEALMPEKPLLLDVGPAARKPENFPAGRPWLPTHRSIPGAIWMPGAGLAPLDAGREALFYSRIGELTQGNKSKPIVVFCQPGCWGSWNAGKRLVLKGYTGVRWFPAGIDGWQEMHETAAVEADADWQ